MRRTLVATMVLGLLAAAAPAAMTYTVTYVNSYTVTQGSGAVVDVYTVSFDAGAGRKMGSLVLTVGTNTLLGGQDPFQAGYKAQSPVPPYPITDYLTPTRDDANGILSTDTTLLACDSSFLPPGIGSSTEWPTTTAAPDETNDGSIHAVVNDFLVGAGSMIVAKAIPPLKREQTIDAIMVGVIHTSAEGVWVHSGSADDLGVVTELEFLIPPIPEPATMGLLALGMLGLVRRRRS